MKTPARAIVARQCSTVASGGDAGALTRKQNRLPVDQDGAALTLIQYPICPFWCVGAHCRLAIAGAVRAHMPTRTGCL